MLGFRERWPDVSLELREHSPPEDRADATVGEPVRRDVAEGRADVGVGLAWEEFEGFVIYRAGIAVGISEGHPLRVHDEISIESLVDSPLLLAPSGFLSRSLVESAFKEIGAEPRVAFVSPNPSTLLSLGEAGFGIPLVADDAVPGRATDAWPRLHGSSGPLASDVCLSWLRGAPRSAAVDNFIEGARQAVAGPDKE
jgi:DNA-binding transcriptional LysR family regulator